MQTHEENILDDVTSPNHSTNLSKLPYHPRSFYSIVPSSHITKRTHFNPIASTLGIPEKLTLDSTRKYLIEANNNNSLCEVELELPNADNSVLPIVPPIKKRTNFSDKSHNVIIPSRSMKNEESELSLDIFSLDKIKEIFEKLLNNNYWILFITLLTIYCLFGEDFKSAFISKNYDMAFNVISIVCIVVFSLEIVASITIKPAYYRSFFFYLDLISCISIFLDLAWIQNLIFLGGQSSNIARASRFSRFGAKIGRVIRLVRLFRIVKFYKTVFEKQRIKELKEINEIRKQSLFYNDLHVKSVVSSKKQPVQQKENIRNSENLNSIFYSPYSSEKWYLSPTLKEIYKRHSKDPKSSFNSLSYSPDLLNLNENISDSEINNEENQSRVGKRLTDLTIKRVLILVFIMIFVVPLFSSNYWFEHPLSYEIGLKLIKEYSQNMQNTSNNNSYKDDQDHTLTDLCLKYTEINTVLNINDKVVYPLVELLTPLKNTACTFTNDFINNDLRDEEKYTVSFGEYNATISKKAYSVNNSYISIARTIFICMLLAIGAFCFAKDAQDLVLRPIERMVIKVNNISKNPFASKYQKLIEKPEEDAQYMETIFIENAIIKISTLLVLGLGDAGSEIITSNIEKMGDLVCITPGIKRYGIFGFCDIRNFNESTEVLQEDVMLFVNNIAEIVHTLVDRFQGSTNKNMGNAFLLVWKFQMKDYAFIEEKLRILWKDPKEMNELKLNIINGSKIININNNSSISDLTDLSLMSFLKILCKINRKAQILQYSKNSLLNTHLNGYKVRMGFGLHLGWAIEGSIGSDYKIDASYLSPNVNIASRLEVATRQYGVPLLISHTVHEFLSNKMKQICRKIDVITVKGSRSPLGIYTVDLDVDNLPFKAQSIKSSKDIREINVLKKMGVAFGLQDKTFPFEELFFYDKDISLALKPMDKEIQEIFNTGIEEYLKGNWEKAEELLDKTMFYKEHDGPCKALLNFMAGFEFKCPKNWAGFRQLFDK